MNKYLRPNNNITHTEDNTLKETSFNISIWKKGVGKLKQNFK